MSDLDEGSERLLPLTHCSFLLSIDSYNLIAHIHHAQFSRPCATHQLKSKTLFPSICKNPPYFPEKGLHQCDSFFWLYSFFREPSDGTM